MSYTLIGRAGDTNSNKILALNAFIGKPLTVKITKPDEDRKKDSHIRNPASKVPYLQTSAGPIFETNTILRLLARRCHCLAGQAGMQAALINQWLDFTTNQIEIPAGELLGQISSRKTLDASRYEFAKKELQSAVKIVDAHLRTRTFLVGNTITIADISLAVSMVELYRLLIDNKMREALPNVTRWYRHVLSLPPLVEVMGVVAYCEEEHKMDFKATQRSHIRLNIPTRSQQSKFQIGQVSPLKSPKRIQTKKESDEDAQLLPTKGPFDHLVATPFDLSLFKKKFFTEENKSQVMKEFWKNLDYHGWSLWKVEYQKYQGQGTDVTKTGNLMRGMLRNMDPMFKKYAFASVGVYGKEGNFEIRSVWLWRGDEVPIFWQNHQSYDYHKFRRLSSNSETDRQLVQTYWTQNKEGQIVEGLPIVAVEYFK